MLFYINKRKMQYKTLNIYPSYRQRLLAAGRWSVGSCGEIGKLNIIEKKKTSTFLWRFVFALPIFTASHPATIVGVHLLNFCVRDGNRWTLMTINTNYIIVQPKLLQSLVTRTGFEPMLTAWEAAVLTTWPMGHWCTFRDSNPGPTD